MIAYDVNHDGKADVIASSAHKFGIWWFERTGEKDGDAAFVKHDLFPNLVSETHALIAADINRDGLKDLVTGKRFWSHGRSEAGSDKPARLYWFEAAEGADGKITFTPREIDDQSGIGTQFVVTDFNGDGLLDIVTCQQEGRLPHRASQPESMKTKIQNCACLASLRDLLSWNRFVEHSIRRKEMTCSLAEHEGG